MMAEIPPEITNKLEKFTKKVVNDLQGSQIIMKSL